jgi:hypothetical protein
MKIDAQRTHVPAQENVGGPNAAPAVAVTAEALPAAQVLPASLPPALPPSFSAPLPPPVSSDAADWRELFGSLVSQVQSGPKPPSDVPMAQAGDMSGAAPATLPLYFAALFADVAKTLGLANKEAIPEDVKASMQEMLLQTNGLQLPLDPAVPGGFKPSPALVAKVADLMRGSGQMRGTDQMEAAQKQTDSLAEPVIIPGPEIVALEKGISESRFDFSTMDIETAVALVMFEAGKDADNDVRDLLKQMDSTRMHKDALRRMMTAMGEQQRGVEQQIRAEFDERRALPTSDKDHIPDGVTFDEYKMARGVEFPIDANGHYDPSRQATLSDSWPMYEQETQSGGGVKPGVDARPHKPPKVKGPKRPKVKWPKRPIKDLHVKPPKDLAVKVPHIKIPVKFLDPKDPVINPVVQPGLDVGIKVNVALHSEVAHMQSGAEAESTAKQAGTFGDFQSSIDGTKNDIDSLSEMSETESLRLQMYMDRRAKMYSTLSNLMKSMSDTASGIIANIK